MGHPPYRRFPQRSLSPHDSPKIKNLREQKAEETCPDVLDTLRTYRTPHDPIVVLRGIENRKFLLDIFPRLGFDLAFVEGHRLVSSPLSSNSEVVLDQGWMFVNAGDTKLPDKMTNLWEVGWDGWTANASLWNVISLELLSGKPRSR